jgi:hypothetical protein
MAWAATAWIWVRSWDGRLKFFELMGAGVFYASFMLLVVWLF